MYALNLTREDLRRCRVCGFDTGYLPWGRDGHSPDYATCRCCQVEFGYGDTSLAKISYQRTVLLAEEPSWWSYDRAWQPVGWSLAEQLKQIPAAFCDAAIAADHPHQADPRAICRVCGYDTEYIQAAAERKPMRFYPCDCCGVGYYPAEFTLQVAAVYRRNWLADGAPWFNPHARPTGWAFEAQLAQIPEPLRPDDGTAGAASGLPALTQRVVRRLRLDPSEPFFIPSAKSVHDIPTTSWPVLRKALQRRDATIVPIHSRTILRDEDLIRQTHELLELRGPEPSRWSHFDDSLAEGRIMAPTCLVLVVDDAMNFVQRQPVMARRLFRAVRFSMRTTPYAASPVRLVLTG